MNDKTLRDALEAQREALGEERYTAISAILDGESIPLPGAAPKATEPAPKADATRQPVAQPALYLSPRWEGAAYVLGFLLVAGGIYWAVGNSEEPKAPMGGGAAASADHPDVKPSPQIVASGSESEMR